ncbi:hypothetical protein ACLESO_25315 [Pyxidicoccus sp. 3LG]
MSFFRKQWLGVLAVAGVMASAACGVDGMESSQEQLPLAESKQGLHIDLYSKVNNGAPVTSGNTFGGSNNFSPPTSCANSSGGPDISFKWTVPATGNYTLSTEIPLDSVLHVYTWHDTTATNLLGCNDEAPGAVYKSSLNLNLTAGQVLRIIVDSYEPPISSRGGAFSLNILPNFPLCPQQNACQLGNGVWNSDANGSSCSYQSAPVGTACNDGQACTVNDTCQSNGQCLGQQKVCNSRPSQCHSFTGTCDPTDGQCDYDIVEGVACSDGLGCTRYESCNSDGSCGPGEDICQGGNYCTPSGCQPLP